MKSYIITTIPRATKVNPPSIKIQCTSFLVANCKRIISIIPNKALNHMASHIESYKFKKVSFLSRCDI